MERGTLNQPGTKPFHLRAVLALTRAGSGEPDRTGEVEYWWAAPDRYRRELHSASFRQTEIRSGKVLWQQNQSDYLPFWLNAIARKLIEPVTPDELRSAKEADARHLLGATYYRWTEISSGDGVQKGMGAGVRINDKTGLLKLDSLGNDKVQAFGDREIALSVAYGTPEVTGTITLLEDLSAGDYSMLDMPKTPSSELIQVVKVDEATVRKSLEPTPAPAWPAVQDGPLVGAFTVRLHLDRTGRPRECEGTISDNPALDAYARNYVCHLRFRPILAQGVPVQVESRLTMPFKTTRPAGAEGKESAKDYFERGRSAGFPATGRTPYVLRADIQALNSSGKIETGKYEDVFQDERHWRREATLGGNHLIRSRDGEQYYRLQQGSAPGAVQTVLRAMEPIPAIDTFTESDWRSRRVELRGQSMVEVLTGVEASDGTLDPAHARAYWFDAGGQLRQAYFNGLEVRRLQTESFTGKQVARTTAIYRANNPILLVRVTDLSENPPQPDEKFRVKGNEWERRFTDEVR